MIRTIDIDDDAALAQHVAFERAHGISRFSVDELRAWARDVDELLLLRADDGSGTMSGCATASLQSAFGHEHVILNAFVAEGDGQTLAALVDAVANDAIAYAADDITAYVSGASDAQLADWYAVGFTHDGNRSRMIRMITPADLDLRAEPPDGVEIVALADRPELESAVVDLINECMADIPTPLPFRVMDRRDFRASLGLSDVDPMVPGLLIAVTGADEVVGMGLLAVHDAEHGIAGHRLTATTRAWRGRGLALAAKIELLRWAARSGIVELRTSNDEANAPMRAINARLGYREHFRMAILRRPIRR